MRALEWAEQLEQHGRVLVNSAAEEAKLKSPMCCPLSGRTFGSVAAVKEYLRSDAYASLVRLRHVREDVVYMQ